jgi:hypothetical protein
MPACGVSWPPVSSVAAVADGDGVDDERAQGCLEATRYRRADRAQKRIILDELCGHCCVGQRRR